jgi:hypothetical protein
MAFDKLCNVNLNSSYASSYMTPQMYNKGAMGMVNCANDLGPMVQTCQDMGKKVFLGLGGQLGNVTFDSDEMAEKGASLLWDLFGGGDGEGYSVRPLGNVTVDGIDLGMSPECSHHVTGL